MRLAFLVFSAIFIFSCTSQAQQVQTSLLGGSHKVDFQTFIVHPLDKNGNFTFTNLAFFQRYQETEDQPFDELGVQGAVFWNMTKSLGIGPGLYYNNPKGFMPKVMLQTYHQLGPVTLITNPAIYYHEDNYTGGELFGQATFIEEINNTVSLFLQANGLTTWDRLEDHGRSYFQFRAGPRFSKGFQLGLGYDKDWYGPQKLSQSSVGVFIEQWF